MDLILLARLLWLRERLRGHERWSRPKLKAHQARALAELRAFAVARSPFYRHLHAGMEAAPLRELPVVTKADLMGSFDELVTDSRVRRTDVEAFLAAAGPDDRYLGRYWVTATSGSTGRPGLFLFDRCEWAWVLASFARAPDWAGIATGLTHRTRTAVVSSTVPTHMSSRVGATLRSPFVPTLRLDSVRPMAELIEQLNAFRPGMLVAYASMAGLLADEQAAGRLHIAPRVVFTSSEVLTDEARRRVERAWGAGVVFNQYAATEGAGLAAECQQHRGLHLFEDLAIVEVVDAENQAVPPGTYGEKVLLTVLWSRTQPLIRYELSDSLRLSAEPCRDGRPLRLADGIQGRTEDTLYLPGAAGGTVAVRPGVFHRLFDTVPVAAWQVVQDPSRLRVLVAQPRGRFTDEALAADIQAALSAQGALPPSLTVERVDEIPRTSTGKAPLIRAARGHERP